MEHIKFHDSCEILRSTGTFDEYDEPVSQVVYKGECLYEEGRANINGIITLRPTLYIPTDGIKERIDINDTVRTETWTGRKIESLVKVPRDIRLRMVRQFKVTRLDLKQATEE